MNVQWQLVDVETKETYATLGEPFDLQMELLKEDIEKQYIGIGSGKAIGILKDTDNKDDGCQKR